jgi:DNA-binding IclR family transcriptional regulator
MNKPHKARAAKRAKSPHRTPIVKTDRHFVMALARGLEVLACFRHGDRMLGNQELSKRCGLAKSTVSRLTHTLTNLGYLIYVEESAKYSLGMATLSLGSAMLSRLDIRKLAHPLMQRLAEFGQCMVSLGSRDRLSMIYIDAVRGSAAVTLSLDSGARIQIATSAMGRAYLTAVSESERNDIMERVRKLADVNRWPELQRGVAKALRDVRELGVCCSFGEWQKDVNAIALPVRPGGGLPPMAINCGAPAYMVSKEFLLEKVRPRLIALANELETSLGTAG